MHLLSAAFPDDGPIPVVHTCEGRDVSPPLRWGGLPPGTASLALVVDDPDAPDPAAPKTTWVHWVVYDLPPNVGGLDTGASTALPHGARDGTNDWRRTGWRGPCPPIGRHRYVVKLYALDVALGDRGALTKGELESVMAGHVLDRAQLVGNYARTGHPAKERPAR
jgi:Raf kinase inhibitor-like YbhB/YbcL family protein